WLVERWQTYATSGEAIDIVPEMMWMSLSILGKITFNVAISSTPEKVGPAVRLGLEAMMPQGNMNDFIPAWAPTPHNARINRAKAALDAVMDDIIEQHRRNPDTTSDLISMMLAAKDKETGEGLTEEEV